MTVRAPAALRQESAPDPRILALARILGRAAAARWLAESSPVRNSAESAGGRGTPPESATARP